VSPLTSDAIQAKAHATPAIHHTHTSALTNDRLVTTSRGSMHGWPYARIECATVASSRDG
jgi:DNA-binding IscR family transcriptional regulator